VVVIELCLAILLSLNLSKRHLLASHLIQDFLWQLASAERLNMDKVTVVAAITLLKSGQEPLDRVVVIVSARHCLVVLRRLAFRRRTLLHWCGNERRARVTHPVLLVSALYIGGEMTDGKIISENEAARSFRRFESHLGSDFMVCICLLL
jgi:hypothetical protein